MKTINPPQYVPNNPKNPAMMARKTMPCKYCGQVIYAGRTWIRANLGLFLHYPICWEQSKSDISWQEGIKSLKK